MLCLHVPSHHRVVGGWAPARESEWPEYHTVKTLKLGSHSTGLRQAWGMSEIVRWTPDLIHVSCRHLLGHKLNYLPFVTDTL